jgi:hypothetical protein
VLFLRIAPVEGRNLEAGIVFFWIYNYPPALIGASFSFVTVATTLVGIILLGPKMRRCLHADRPANDVIGYTLSSFSVLYGILLGLLAVESYQNYTAANDVVSKEASTISALYRDFGGYPPPHQSELQDGLRSYVSEVVEKSWPMQRRGLLPTGEARWVTALFNKMVRFNPAEKSQEMLHAEALRQFNNFVEARRVRLNNIGMGIPSILWWVVLMGAIVHIVLILMLDIRPNVHMMLGGLLSFYIGLVIFSIAAMDNPFRGEVSGNLEPIQQVLTSLMSDR